MPRRALPCLALLAGALCVLGSAGAAPQENRTSFADPAGDQTQTAPDVTAVVVSNSDQGRLTFEIQVANYATLVDRLSFIVFLDTDTDTATGNPFGADHALVFGYQEAGVLTRAVGTWRSGDFRYALPRSLITSYTAAGTGGVATLSVDRADVGTPRALRFAAYGYWFVQPARNYYWDSAPSLQSTTFSYDLRLAAVASKDVDRDGVPDARDRCPRAGAFFDFNQNGCTGPFRRMRPDLKFRALGYASHVEMASARIENLPAGALVDVRCRTACRVTQQQTAKAPIVVLTRLQGARLDRGAVLEIRAVKPGWIGYDARIEIRGSPLSTHLTERCLPAMGARLALPCGQVERGR